SARVTVITAGEMATIVADNPLLDVAVNPSRSFVCVLNDPGDRRKLKPLEKENWAPEALALGSRVAYFWCPDGILESRLAAAIGRVLRDAATTRNWATISKLHALMDERH